MNKTRGNFCRGAEEEGAIRGNMAAGTSPLGKLQQEKSRMIQARKTLKWRDKVLTAAIRRCHIELAERTSFGKIEASKDAVEAAWNEFNHATARYCMHAGGDLSRKELDEQPEEARRAWYEWKAISNMMDEVVDKAEEYLEESATRENYCDDEDGGNELDAEMEVRLWVEQLSIMSKVNEMALEVSAANEMNANEVNDVNKVNEESTVNKVNEESTVNEDDRVVCNFKEVAPEVSNLMIKEVELHIAHKAQVEIIAEALEEQNGAKVWEPGESGVAKVEEVKSDVNVEAKVEVFGMKEVKNLKDEDKVEVFNAKVNNGKVGLRLYDKKAEVNQSHPANWDPGEPVNAKEEIEMLEVKEAEILVNIINKVGLQLSVKEVRLSSGAIKKALLVVLFLLRFVNRCRPDCPIEVSDYG